MLRKEGMIDKLVERGYTKKAAKEILKDVFGMITDELANGESVQIHGFGTFEVRDYAERETVDYQTKKRFVVPAYKAPKFVSGKLLKRAVKEGFVREQ